MTDKIEIRVPDIGDIDAVEVIELLIAVGDHVEAEQSLITLESDKASMEIPATHTGTVSEIAVALGDNIATGDLIVTLSANTAQAKKGQTPNDTEATAAASVSSTVGALVASSPASQSQPSTTQVIDVIVPDIGDFDVVEVIEVLAAAGDQIELDQSLITLESDKASMEIPSTVAGSLQTLLVAIGDQVASGAIIARIETTSTARAPVIAAQAQSTAAEDKSLQPTSPAPAAADSPTTERRQTPRSPTEKIAHDNQRKSHASPAVRKFARQLGVDLTLVQGSGNKSRILKSDVKIFVKSTMESAGRPYGTAQSPATSANNLAIAPIPAVDFSKFGETERVEMSRINKLTAQNLHRAWLNLPLVTYHEDADITEMEDFRQSIKAKATENDIRVTGLVFHVKALAATLKAFPRFNSSLAPDGESLFYKKYFNVGIAVDTPTGLVVPVLKDANNKSIYQLSQEMSELSVKAREKKLKPDDMQGASMTISSLGGIGGTAFTPIVNPPEVAILGITRAKMQPVWNGSEFIPRLICPLDITYDHRVIDGAAGARFMAHYCGLIGDIRQLLL